MSILFSFPRTPARYLVALAFVTALSAQTTPVLPPVVVTPVVVTSPAPTPKATPASRLINLSVRTKLAAGNNLIVGFILSGSETARVLVRGVGPALIPYGVADAMPNPTLTLSGIDNRGASVSIANDDWEATTGLQQADFVKALPISMEGAFPLPAGSRDAALLVDLKPGPSTIKISGNPSTDAGTVLAEVYDTRSDSEVGTTRLVNLSALGVAGPTAPVLAGFVVDGTESIRLLLRVSGPALTTFGVAGAASAARLDLMDQKGVVIRSNAGWDSGSAFETLELRQTFNSVGAFPFIAGSRNAAVIVTVPPGVYTLQGGGVDGVNGSVLLEIYELSKVQGTVTVANE